MFEAYLNERLQARAARRRLRYAIGLSLAVTGAACIHAYIGTRLSIEALPGGRLHWIFVASFDEPLPPPPPPPTLAWQGEEKINGGIFAQGDGLPSVRATKARGISQTNARVRVRSRLPECPAPETDPPPKTEPPCLPGAPCSVAALAWKSPVPRSPPQPRVVQPREPLIPIPSFPPRALYTPPPSSRAIARTYTGLRDPHSGTVEVDYCVDERGHVVDASISREFVADRQIDAIVLRTIRRWRFRPLVVRGRAHKTCTSTRFDIVFEAGCK